MAILITICARGGSKGIPGKNIKPLNGKPLIYYTIDTARQFQKQFGDVDIALSTDSGEIKKTAADYGLTVDYTRPAELAGDSVGKIDAIADVLRFYEQKGKEYSYVLDMDVTSPLRNLDDLVKAFALIKNNPEAINLFSVSPPSRNPYFNMVERQENGFCSIVKRPPDGIVFARQSAPLVYDMNASFYFYKKIFFDKKYRGAVTDKSLVYVVPHICFDLDHPIDFEFLSFLLVNNKLDFSL
jgi:CMP-N-acetylneuraminic acid synthetase